MKVVVQIGYSKFAFESVKIASAVVEALAKAVVVESEYKDGRETYSPAAPKHGFTTTLNLVREDAFLLRPERGHPERLLTDRS